MSEAKRPEPACDDLAEAPMEAPARLSADLSADLSAQHSSSAPGLVRLKTLAIWLLLLGLGAMSLQGQKLHYPDGYQPALWSCSVILAP